MKIEFGGKDLRTNPCLEGPVIDWAKGLGEQKVARMELYDRPNRPVPPALVVTLLDGSLYLIRRVLNSKNKSSSPTITIENTTSSSFVFQPIITITFQSHPRLLLILHICYSVPQFKDHEPNIDSRSFGLAVFLNTIRLLLKSLPPSGSSTKTQFPLNLLWKDVYQLMQEHYYDSRESLLDRTRNLTRELLYAAAYDALKEKYTGMGDNFKLTAYSTIAREEVLASREGSPSDTWNQSWIDSQLGSLWSMFLAPAKPFSSRLDARDSPHRYRLGEILGDTSLAHAGFIGREWDEVTPGPSCIMTGASRSQLGDRIIIGAVDAGEAQFPATAMSAPIQSINDSSCDCHVWVSDWQIASHLGWSYAWHKAFESGQNTAKAMVHPSQDASNVPAASGQSVPVNRPRANPHSHGTHPAILGIINFQSWAASKFCKKKAENHQPIYVNPTAINERSYQDLKKIICETAERHLDAREKRSIVRLEARLEMLQYQSKASERAFRSMRQQGGGKGLDYLAQQAWQGLSAGPVLRRLSEQGRVANAWKRNFRERCEQIWSYSWEDTWLTTWENAYQSAKSMGVEFGVGLAIQAEIPIHETLLEGLKSNQSYKSIQADIKHGGIDDILNHVRLCVQYLDHMSNLVAVHGAGSNHVTMRTLVLGQDQLLQDVLFAPPEQLVPQELSYVELKHFIEEVYFKKNQQTHASFQSGVLSSWENISTLLDNEAVI